MSRRLAVLVMCLILTGCAANVPPPADPLTADGGAVRQVKATIVGVRPVPLGGSQTGFGAVVGAAAGGAAGAQAGGGGAATVAVIIAGVLIGQVAGAMIEEAATRGAALEYEVEFETGARTTVVQGGQARLAPGQPVTLVYGSQLRLVPVAP